MSINNDSFQNRVRFLEELLTDDEIAELSLTIDPHDDRHEAVRDFARIIEKAVIAKQSLRDRGSDGIATAKKGGQEDAPISLV